MNPLMELFQTELNSNLSVIESCFKENKYLNIDSLIKAFHEIKGGAKIIQQSWLADLAEAFELYWAGIKSDPSLFLQSQVPILQAGIMFLKNVGSVNLENWDSFTQKQREAITSLLEQLRSICKVSKQEFPPNPVAHKNQQEKQIDATMFDLFRAEVETQTAILNQGLIEYEKTEEEANTLESLMRAAHSIKGAARVLRLDEIVHLAHAIEDCFVAVQKTTISLQPEHVDLILSGVDLLSQIKNHGEDTLYPWLNDQKQRFQEVATDIKNQLLNPVAPLQKQEPKAAKKLEEKALKEKGGSSIDRVIRVTAQNLNRLMGLAGESLVESRWLEPFGNSLLHLKKGMKELSSLGSRFRELLDQVQSREVMERQTAELQHSINACNQNLNERIAELDMFILRHSSLSDRLYREVIDIRMRPFADVMEGFPRMVRDVARQLGKKIKLEILGKNSAVDRDILDKLEAPLSHLVRNAIDHGIESPEERVRSGKPEEGVVKVEAMHRAGMLAISVSDDGKGVDLEVLRKTIVDKNLANDALAAVMTETELLNFLFLPGFSTATHVSEISGRGVGLNIVQNMLQEVSGTVRVTTIPGKGISFQLLLPLTLSVIRALIVEISQEPYAFPLSRIDRALNIPKSRLDLIEGHQYFKFEGTNIGLVPAAQILELKESPMISEELPVVILSDHINTYGIVVDRFLGERELVVLELDHRLGKVADISAGALMEDGTPILIVDVEDLVRSIDHILSRGSLHHLGYAGEVTSSKKRKRILIIDDSITVREVESRLLQAKGYDVLAAINGMDGLNALRIGQFDLVITDMDMPRMNGVELLKLIRKDPRLHKIPVMIVSYKERTEDRMLALEAGADFYLTKGSFHDETLLKTVGELIGQP